MKKLLIHTSKRKLFPGKSRIEIIVEDCHTMILAILAGGIVNCGEKFYWFRKYFVLLSNKSLSVEHLRPLFHLDRHKNFFICLRGKFHAIFQLAARAIFRLLAQTSRSSSCPTCEGAIYYWIKLAIRSWFHLWRYQFNRCQAIIQNVVENSAR